MQNSKYQAINKTIKYIAWKALGAFIFVAVAGTSIWALAAFTEPTAGPSSSVQDFAKNIMGADNSDNDFDSGDVVANSDGSIVERLESLEVWNDTTALSTEQSSAGIISATNYCFNLSAQPEYVIDGSNIGTTYSDWRVPPINDLNKFVGVTSSANYLWTNYGYSANQDYFFTVRLSDGNVANKIAYNGLTQFRCVR